MTDMGSFTDLLLFKCLYFWMFEWLLNMALASDKFSFFLLTFNFLLIFNRFFNYCQNHLFLVIILKITNQVNISLKICKNYFFLSRIWPLNYDCFSQTKLCKKNFVELVLRAKLRMPNCKKNSAGFRESWIS